MVSDDSLRLRVLSKGEEYYVTVPFLFSKCG